MKLIISGQPKTGNVLHHLRLVFSAVKIMSPVLNYLGVKIIRGIVGIRQEIRRGDKMKIWKVRMWTGGCRRERGRKTDRELEHSSGRAQGRV